MSKIGNVHLSTEFGKVNIENMQHKMERFLKCVKKKKLSNCFEGLYLDIPGQ